MIVGDHEFTSDLFVDLTHGDLDNRSLSGENLRDPYSSTKSK